MLNSSDVIYVVGFPKSGNTWLTRLVADALGRPVQDRVMRGSPEIAADVNAHHGGLNAERGHVAKVHFMPDFFRREITASPQRVIYVHRDIRDVLVSAFFYFEGTAASSPPPLRLWDRWRGRTAGGPEWAKKFWEFGDAFLREGIGGQEKEFGSWATHIEAWRTFLLSNRETLAAFVSYEQLVRDPVGALEDAFDQLKVVPVEVGGVAAAVDRQSFASLRQRAQEQGDSLQFGKEFNLRFLRQGKVGDWRRYHPRSMIRRFPADVIATMQRLNYI